MNEFEPTPRFPVRPLIGSVVNGAGLFTKVMDNSIEKSLEAGSFKISQMREKRKTPWAMLLVKSEAAVIWKSMSTNSRRLKQNFKSGY